MIGEEQQDQAALYALGLLTADEAAAFEVAMQADPELDVLARELREAVNRLAVLALPPAVPSAQCKAGVLAMIAAAARNQPAGLEPAPPSNVLAFRPLTWLPWALAAGLALYCGSLASERTDLRRELGAAQAADPLAQLAVYTLGPADDKSAAAISVAWEPERQSGMLHFNGLKPPASGKDYQLWAIDAGSKDPISAGLVKIDAQGSARIVVKPAAAASHVKAFAISVEPAGGSPKATGPIVYVGAE